MRFHGPRELGNTLARLHQANRRAAAFEARCAQLLEEKARLEAKVEGWRKIADGYARSASLEYRDKLEDEIRELKAERDEFMAAAEHWRLFHHKAEQRARDAEAENERFREALVEIERLNAGWDLGLPDQMAEVARGALR